LDNNILDLGNYCHYWTIIFLIWVTIIIIEQVWLQFGITIIILGE